MSFKIFICLAYVTFFSSHLRAVVIFNETSQTVILKMFEASVQRDLIVYNQLPNVNIRPNAIIDSNDFESFGHVASIELTIGGRVWRFEGLSTQAMILCHEDVHKGINATEMV